MRNRVFNRVSLLSLITLYLVILAGSVVRMTGSGMGCPDWPKCFGEWIPPTSEDQLPENYREDFAQKREVKIEKFANFLSRLGFKKDAELIRNDQSLRQKEEPFNAQKTWTEYINRLIGFIAGNLILLVFLISIFRMGSRKSIILLAFINLILIAFQAWFGSMVVATNLTPWTISVHMLIALLIVAIQIHILHASKRDQDKRSRRVNNLFRIILFVAIGLSIAQIMLGTQVRQDMDEVAKSLPRSSWIDAMDMDFKIHRSFSILVILVNGLLFYMNFRNQWGYNSPSLLMLVIGLEAIAGIVLAYADMPALVQPIHLMLATFMFGLQIKLLSLTTMRRKV